MYDVVQLDRMRQVNVSAALPGTHCLPTQVRDTRRSPRAPLMCAANSMCLPVLRLLRSSFITYLRSSDASPEVLKSCAGECCLSPSPPPTLIRCAHTFPPSAINSQGR